jgi:hypothetical protein
MKYAVETGSSAIIYVPSLINIGSTIQKLMAGDIQKYRWDGDHISLLLLVFFRIRKVG